MNKQGKYTSIMIPILDTIITIRSWYSVVQPSNRTITSPCTSTTNIRCEYL